MSEPVNHNNAVFRRKMTPRKSTLGQTVNQTHEEEQAYLNLRPGDSSNRQVKGYLPTPEQIAEEAAIIREENEERDRLSRENSRPECRSLAAIYSSLTLDISGMGSRRGKLI